ncbi:hypothetical protein BDQ17DRAFT_1270372 [Cyathus striatus]|nr:hypothetical protein BDQ17DRAFT_1270372 [Cyathus striatus]
MPVEMNSLTDQESASSTPSSGSPPPEEVNFQPPAGSSAGSHFMNIASQITSSFTSGAGSSSKRRLPGGSSFASGSSRDPKSRRRGVEHSRATGPSQWEGSLKEGLIASRKDKDELIDQHLVDYLRREIGDPFLEPDVKH